MKTVKYFDAASEEGPAKGLLESEGIEAVVPNENTGLVMPVALTNPGMRPHPAVRDEDYWRAAGLPGADKPEKITHCNHESQSPLMPDPPVTETHPFPPFLPGNARLLMLGSFPPPRERWSMEFFYPNLQNDMWRIVSLAFFGDKDHFVAPGGKMFDKDRIAAFLTEKGIALSDTAHSVIRHKGNASDKFLEIFEAADIGAMLKQIPQCGTIVTTGDKASHTLSTATSSEQPQVGSYVGFCFAGRTLRHYRMPSSSRAYPKPLSEKADIYKNMFREAGIL